MSAGCFFIVNPANNCDMKSFIAYPFESENLSYPQKLITKLPLKMFARHEVLRKIKLLDGAIIKCGITAEEGLADIAAYRDMFDPLCKPRLVAFQKYGPCIEEGTFDGGDILLTVKSISSEIQISQVWTKLVETGKCQHVEVVPGNVCDTVPEYLIQNPELKISLLNIDLDDYEGTITALQFFYHRIVAGGVLLINNLHNSLSEQKAIEDYFDPGDPIIRNLIEQSEVRFIVKD